MATDDGVIPFFIPVIVAVGYFALYPPVVVMEKLGVRATLKRTHALMKRSWAAVLAITVLQFSVPTLILIGAKNLISSSAHMKWPSDSRFRKTPGVFCRS